MASWWRAEQFAGRRSARARQFGKDPDVGEGLAARVEDLSAGWPRQRFLREEAALPRLRLLRPACYDEPQVAARTRSASQFAQRPSKVLGR